jgi:hypothetical protein
MNNYKDSFYNPDIPYSYEFIQCFKKPAEYKGYLIYPRVVSIGAGGDIFDVVKDGVCLHTSAALDYAKKFIDRQEAK